MGGASSVRVSWIGDSERSTGRFPKSERRDLAQQGFPPTQRVVELDDERLEPVGADGPPWRCTSSTVVAIRCRSASGSVIPLGVLGVLVMLSLVRTLARGVLAALLHAHRGRCLRRPGRAS